MEVDNATSEDVQQAVNADRAEELKSKLNSAKETKAEEITASTAILGEQDDYSMLTDGIEYENAYVSSELILKSLKMLLLRL